MDTEDAPIVRNATEAEITASQHVQQASDSNAENIAEDEIQCDPPIASHKQDSPHTITQAAFAVPTMALIVREPWINLILDGTKKWEIRSEPTQKRERIALATTQPYLLLGDVEIVDSTVLTHEDFQTHVASHCVDESQQEQVIGSYKRIHAWHLRRPRRYANPIAYVFPTDTLNG